MAVVFPAQGPPVITILWIRAGPSRCVSARHSFCVSARRGGWTTSPPWRAADGDAVASVQAAAAAAAA